MINIGSNLGNRRLNLSRAMRAVGDEFGDFEMSHVVESAPWGFDSTNSFLNVGITFHTDLAPEEVLVRLQKIESSVAMAACAPEAASTSHRDATGGYIDRYIDIDIIFIDRQIIDTPTLKVPHPHLAGRRFFLEPLEELTPGWTHPVTGLTAAEMIASLPPETPTEN